MDALHIHIYPDEETWAQHTAEAIRDLLRRTVEQQGRTTLALSGGHTPKPVYTRLARMKDIPWEHIFIYWGDERYVPYEDPRSNYRMARETLLDHIAIPEDHVFPMPTHFETPEEGARAYEATLRATVAGGRFDLILLGLGTDCHTASLFPHTPALEEEQRWVVPNRGPDIPRLTFTYPLINRARTVYFLVTGASKHTPVRQVLYGEADRLACPARGVRPEGTCHWWLDAAAGPDVYKEDA